MKISGDWHKNGSETDSGNDEWDDDRCGKVADSGYGETCRDKTIAVEGRHVSLNDIMISLRLDASEIEALSNHLATPREKRLICFRE